MSTPRYALLADLAKEFDASLNFNEYQSKNDSILRRIPQIDEIEEKIASKKALIEQLENDGVFDIADYIKKKYSIVDLLLMMPSESVLQYHNNWLSNQDIDAILRICQQLFPRFISVPTATSDFMFCNMRGQTSKDLDEGNYDKNLLLMNKIIQSSTLDDFPLDCDTNKHRTICTTRIEANMHQVQLNLEKIEEMGMFPDVTADTHSKLSRFLQNSAQSICGFVINTDTCKQSGSHWICIVLDKEQADVSLFNSTSFDSYAPIMPRLKFMLVYWSLLMKKYTERDVITININAQSIQRLSYTCGLFALAYILSRNMGKTNDETVNILAQSTTDEIPRMIQEYFFSKNK